MDWGSILPLHQAQVSQRYRDFVARLYTYTTTTTTTTSTANTTTANTNAATTIAAATTITTTTTTTTTNNNNNNKSTAVAQWLGCCATNRKVAGSIPAGVNPSDRNGPGVDSASNRNEYQEHFLGVKVAGA